MGLQLSGSERLITCGSQRSQRVLAMALLRTLQGPATDDFPSAVGTLSRPPAPLLTR